MLLLSNRRRSIVKNRVAALALVALFGASIFVQPWVHACEGEGHAEMKSSKGTPRFVLSEAGKKQAVFQIAGMSCGSCEKSVTAQLKKVQGVEGVEFQKKKGTSLRMAVIRFKDGAQVDPARLVDAVSAAGYQATAVD
jgi:copper chaperone CopZ